ncbi:MAG: hypothetical protein LBT43_19100 [Prevotella sp.]|nr:hypothetical protein [Prevotella sp.]
MTIGVNPNDKTAIKTLVLEQIDADSFDEDTCWCNKCQDYTEATVAEIIVENMPEENLFHAWQLCEQDLFMVSIGLYNTLLGRKPNPETDENITGGHFIFFTEKEAKKQIEGYFSLHKAGLPDSAYFHSRIRKIDISHQERIEYNDVYSVAEKQELKSIKPIYENITLKINLL